MDAQHQPPDNAFSDEPHATTGTASQPFGVGKADLAKRIIAAVIDGVVGGVLNLIPMVGWLAGGAYFLLRDGLEVEFMDRRSLGKKLMKLRPVRADGLPMDIETSVKRNWPLTIGYLAGIPVFGWILAIPIALIAMVIVLVELILVVSDANGRRWGDKMANTHVIEVGS